MIAIIIVELSEFFTYFDINPTSHIFSSILWVDFSPF